MNRVILKIILLTVMVVSSAAAQNNYTPAATYYPIQQLTFYSTTEPLYPQWAGFTHIVFSQTLSWSTPNVCDNRSAVIRPADKHILSAVLAAYATGKGLRIYADDVQKLGEVCIIRALGIAN